MRSRSPPPNSPPPSPSRSASSRATNNLSEPRTTAVNQRSAKGMEAFAKRLAKATGVHQLKKMLGSKKKPPPPSLATATPAPGSSTGGDAQSTTIASHRAEIVRYKGDSTHSKKQKALMKPRQIVQVHPKDLSTRSELAQQLSVELTKLPSLSNPSSPQSRGMSEISAFLRAFNVLIKKFPELNIDPNLQLSPLVASATDGVGLQDYHIRKPESGTLTNTVSADFRHDRLEHEIDQIDNLGTGLNPNTHAYSDFSKIRRTIVKQLKSYQNADQVPLERSVNASSNVNSFIILAKDGDTAETQGVMCFKLISDPQSQIARCISIENLISSQSTKGIGKLLMLSAIGLAHQQATQNESTCPVALETFKSSEFFYKGLGLTSIDSSYTRSDDTTSYTSGDKPVSDILENFFSEPMAN